MALVSLLMLAVAVVVFIVATEVTTSLDRDEVTLEALVISSEDIEPPRMCGRMLLRCAAVVDPPTAFETVNKTVEAAGIKLFWPKLHRRFLLRLAPLMAVRQRLLG